MRSRAWRASTLDPTISAQPRSSNDLLDNLSHAMLLGCVLVVAVLALFLFDWRTALISITAIPLSLIAAALVLHYWGATFNTMVVAGLVIALGEVVDDAIIDVENIQRRRWRQEMRSCWKRQPAPVFDVVFCRHRSKCAAPSFMPA